MSFHVDPYVARLLQAPPQIFPSYADALTFFVKSITGNDIDNPKKPPLEFAPPVPSACSAATLLRTQSFNQVAKRRPIQSFSDFRKKRGEFVALWPEYASVDLDLSSGRQKLKPMVPLKVYVVFTQTHLIPLSLASMLFDYCKAFAPGFEFHMVRPDINNDPAIVLEPGQHTDMELFTTKGWIRDEDVLDAMDEAKNVIPVEAYAAICFTSAPIYEEDNDDTFPAQRLIETSTCLSTEHLKDADGKDRKNPYGELLDWDRYMTVVSTARAVIPPKADENGMYPDGKFDEGLIRRLIELTANTLCYSISLTECNQYSCVMNYIPGYFAEPCPACIEKMRYVLVFDLIDRYEALKSFFVKLKKFILNPMWVDDMIDWFGNALRFVRSTSNNASDWWVDRKARKFRSYAESDPDDEYDWDSVVEQPKKKPKTALDTIPFPALLPSTPFAPGLHPMMPPPVSIFNMPPPMPTVFDPVFAGPFNVFGMPTMSPNHLERMPFNMSPSMPQMSPTHSRQLSPSGSARGSPAPQSPGLRLMSDENQDWQDFIESDPLRKDDKSLDPTPLKQGLDLTSDSANGDDENVYLYVRLAPEVCAYLKGIKKDRKRVKCPLNADMNLLLALSNSRGWNMSDGYYFADGPSPSNQRRFPSEDKLYQVIQTLYPNEPEKGKSEDLRAEVWLCNSKFQENM